MNRPQSGSSGGGGAARGASVAAAKGIALIAIAVIIGIVLLQVSDNHKSSATTTTTTAKKPKTTTTTLASQESTTTVTIAQQPVKSADVLRVIVLNASGVPGRAASLSASLRQQHYTNQDKANTWTGHNQTGDSVLCRAGLDREQVTLIVVVQNITGKTPHSDTLKAPLPPFVDGPPPNDCAVVIGS